MPHKRQQQSQNLSSDVLDVQHDITRNMILESELRKSYRVINQAQALAQIGSWEMDMLSKTILYSDEACRIYGIVPGQYDSTYAGFLRQVHPDNRKIIDHMIKNPSRRPIELEFRFIRQDGSVRNIYQLAEFIFDDKGDPVYLYGTIQDITEKKELQKELLQKQESIDRIQRRFNALIKESSVVYEILDPLINKLDALCRNAKENQINCKYGQGAENKGSGRRHRKTGTTVIFAGTGLPYRSGLSVLQTVIF
jgi:PAS domain S-box-containing protein